MTTTQKIIDSHYAKRHYIVLGPGHWFISKPMRTKRINIFTRYTQIDVNRRVLLGKLYFNVVGRSSMDPSNFFSVYKANAPASATLTSRTMIMRGQIIHLLCTPAGILCDCSSTQQNYSRIAAMMVNLPKHYNICIYKKKSTICKQMSISIKRDEHRIQTESLAARRVRFSFLRTLELCDHVCILNREVVITFQYDKFQLDQHVWIMEMFERILIWFLGWSERSVYIFMWYIGTKKSIVT